MTLNSVENVTKHYKFLAELNLIAETSRTFTFRCRLCCRRCEL